MHGIFAGLHGGTADQKGQISELAVLTNLAKS